MNKPTIRATGVVPPRTGVQLSKQEIADTLSISPPSVVKLLDSGFLRDRSFPTVADLASRPQLEVTDGEIAVLRSSVGKRVDDEDRRYIGVSSSMSPSDFLAATDRWWRVNPERICNAGWVVVTLSTYVVGVLEIHGIAKVSGDGSERRVAFDASLEAQQRGPIERSQESSLPSLDHPGSLLASRIVVESGGPFGFAGTAGSAATPVRPDIFVAAVDRPFCRSGETVEDTLENFGSAPKLGSLFIDHRINDPQQPIPVVYCLDSVEDLPGLKGSFRGTFTALAVPTPATIVDVQNVVAHHNPKALQPQRYAGSTERFKVPGSAVPDVLDLFGL